MKDRRIVIATTLLGCLGALGVLVPAVAGQGAPATAPSVAASEERGSGARTLRVDGHLRRYLVHDFSTRPKAPLVILVHGGGGHAENMVEMTQFDTVARRERLIAVYPEGTGGTPGGRLLTWNAGHCCAYAMRQGVDDVEFISALIDRFVASGRADPDRVYVTGMSNGAMMTHRLGRELTGKLAAIAPVVGALFGDEPAPQGPLPALIVVGEIDQIVPGAGGPLGGNPWGLGQSADRDVAPAVAQAEYWELANGCGDATTRTTTSYVLRKSQGCHAGTEVLYYVVSRAGHAWPGGRAPRPGADPPVRHFRASEVIWDFFSRHRRACADREVE